MTLFFFFKIVSAILVSLFSHIHFRVVLPVSMKKSGLDFGRNCIKCINNLGRIDIFNMLSLPIHEYSILLHLFRSSLVSVINSL